MKKYIFIMTLSSLFWVSIPVLFQSCVGVDNVDLPIIGERIETVSLPFPLIPDQTYPVMVTYFDKYGIEKEVPFEWSSSNPTVANISNKGVVIPLTPGKTNISVSFQGFSKSVGEVIVVNNKRIEVSTTIALPFYPTQKRQIAASYFDALGVYQQVPLRWTTSNDLVASVSNNGQITALTVGKSVIQPSYQNFKGPEIPIEITSGEKIETSALQMELVPGQSRQLTATYFNAGGITTEVPFVWSSSQPNVASVSNTGVVKAVSIGQTLIQSSYQNASSNQVTVTVLNDPDSVAFVNIETTTSSLFVGDKVQLSSIVKNITGQVLVGKPVEWISENSDIVTINTSGQTTAIAAGRAFIHAISKGVKSNVVALSSAVAVNPNTISSITISVSKTLLVVGENLPLTALIKSATGQILVGKQVQWVSSNNDIAKINSANEVVATGIGTVGVHAVSEGLSSNILSFSIAANNSHLNVSKIELPFYPGQTRQVSADYFDALGSPQKVPLTWSTSNSGVASVSGTGLITALAIGKSSIQASYLDIKSPEILIEIVSGEKIETSPLQVSLLPGQSSQLLSSYFNVGGIKTDVPLVWVSSKPVVASVTSTGLVNALFSGQTVIYSSYQNVTGPSINVTVVSDPDSVASIQVSAATISLFVADKVQLSAVLKNVNGRELTDKTIEWVSENTDIATVNSSGEVTALALGSATIYAKSQGIKSNRVTLSSLQRPDPNAASSVTISSTRVKFLVGETSQLSALVKNASGQLLPGKTITWISGNNAIAAVNNTGEVTAKGIGTVTIYAKSEGLSSNILSISVVVANNRIEVSFAPELPFYPGQTRQAIANYFDALGVYQQVPLTWTTSNSGVASVSNTGLVTALAEGKCIIQPSSQSFKGAEIPIEIISGQKIELFPLQVTLLRGKSTQLAATYFNSGGIKTNVSLIWASTQPFVASVSNTGIVKSLSNGQANIQSSYQNFSGPVVSVSVVDDPDSVAFVQVSTPKASLFTGEKVQLSSVVKNVTGQVLVGNPIEWVSENTAVLAINSSGEVTAIATGTGTIYGLSKGIKSNLITLSTTVAPDLNATSSVTISALKASLVVGETSQLSAVTKGSSGQTLIGKTIEWISGNSGMAIVDSNGNLTATGAGSVGIYAKSDGVNSNTLTISVSAPGASRTGMFTKAGGYEAAGTATLSAQNGDLILDLGTDFKTSFALGTFIYLSNSTNGSTIRASAFEVSQITTNGAKTFNISKLKSSVKISDYKYVAVLCKPASVTFGYAELK